MRSIRSNLALALVLMLAAAAVLSPVRAAIADDIEQVYGLLDRGQALQALKKLDKLLKNRQLSKSDQAELRFTRAVVLVQVDRIDDAIKAFEALTQDYPDYPEPLNNLAVLYAERGDFEKARTALTAAISTHSSYATAHENLGDLYARMAREAYNRVLKLEQGNEQARIKLAMLDRIVPRRESIPNTAAAKPEQSTVASSPKPKPKPAAAPKPKPAVAAAKPRQVELTPPRASASTPPSQTSAALSAADRVAAQKRAVLDAVERWRTAWSAQDLEGYLAAYSSEYTPSGGKSLSRWKSERRSRLKRPKFIEVKLNGAQAVMLDAVTAQVTFRQFYRSNTFSDQVNKRVTLQFEAGQWRILREESI